MELTNLKILVAIPSYKRASDVVTAKLFASPKIFVPPDQADEYRKHNNPDSIVEYPLPEGNLARKKNWILDYAKSLKYDVVFFIDDDYEMLYCNGSGMSRKISDPDAIYQVIESHAILARDAKSPLFTFHNIPDIRRYAKHSPISLFTTFKRGNFGVWLDSKLRFDERFVIHEDIDIGLQALMEYRIILSDNRYAFALANEMGATGGLAGVRTSEKQRLAVEALRSKWGAELLKDKGRSWAERLKNYTVSVVNPFA